MDSGPAPKTSRNRFAIENDEFHNKMPGFRSCPEGLKVDVRSFVSSMFPIPCFPFPGLTQTRSPPRPRESAWRRDITDVIWSRGVKQTKQQWNTSNSLASNTPNLYHMGLRRCSAVICVRGVQKHCVLQGFVGVADLQFGQR